MRDASSSELIEYLGAERAYYEACAAPTVSLTDELASEMVARLAPYDVSVPWSLRRFDYFDYLAPAAEHSRLMRVVRGADPDPLDAQVVLDPADLDGHSEYVDVGVCVVSPDERLLAYASDLSGEEIFTLRFRDIDRGEDLPDAVPGTHYGGAWAAESRCFFYTVRDDSYRPYQVRRHNLGTAAEDDVVVFDEPDPAHWVSVRLTRSNRLIVINSSSDDTSEVWLIDATRPEEAPRCVEPRQLGVLYDIEHAPTPANDRVLVFTNRDAVGFAVMTAPVAAPSAIAWTSLIPGKDDERIYGVEAFAAHAVITLRRSGERLIRVVPLAGSGDRGVPRTTSFEIRTDLPGGSLDLGTCSDFHTSEIVVVEQSYVAPPRWLAVDLDSGRRRLLKEQAVPTHVADRYLTEVRTVQARDGTAVPVTLTRHIDTPLDGSAPALFYAYGAYEVTEDARFRPTLPSLLDRGVVFVHVHVRGGGEGGRGWWFDGRLDRKQNTFNDLIDAATGLQGLLDRGRVATRGASAGGLLQGVVFSQRPELWRAVVAEVPFVDVVTTMLDESAPLTTSEYGEWGDPRRPDDFAWMVAYSPYENIPPKGGRPDLLVTGALHDPRVMVSEPAKWVAALRATDPEWSPRCQFRCEVGEGAHGGPSGRIARLRYEAEIYAWVLSRLGGPESAGEGPGS